jgi:hypothetical protein
MTASNHFSDTASTDFVALWKTVRGIVNDFFLLGGDASDYKRRSTTKCMNKPRLPLKAQLFNRSGNFVVLLFFSPSGLLAMC